MNERKKKIRLIHMSFNHFFPLTSIVITIIIIIIACTSNVCTLLLSIFYISHAYTIVAGLPFSLKKKKERRLAWLPSEQ